MRRESMPGQLPLLFACSGCSAAGRAADELARELDRRGLAEMSCLAGIGAAKSHFLKKLENREVWIIDGCPIECSLGVFSQVRRQVDLHIRLHDYGVRKNDWNSTPTESERLVSLVQQQASADSR